jgi:ribonuclease-3
VTVRSDLASAPARRHDDEVLALAERLGIEFDDLDLLRQAVSHRSWCAENGGRPSNERLEFLGDSVVGLFVTDHSYRRYPDLAESELSRVRAAVVSATALAEVAMELELGSALLLGKGEAATGGRAKTSILADALEAVIGAVYLDQGRSACEQLVLRLLADRIDAAADGPGVLDYKSQLQELVARRGDEPPTYELKAAGPDHRKTFEARVKVSGHVVGDGSGSTKKAAEQAAAESALSLLRTASGADGAEE